MNLLLLPGNSKRNAEWLMDVEAELAPLFKKSYRHNYAHWETGEPEIDLQTEIERISKLGAEYDPYMIFAKSAGTMLALKAIAEGVLKPAACLFTGIPLAMVSYHELPLLHWLLAVDVPVVIVQNQNDPYGKYEDVLTILKETKKPNFALVELTGDTHDYDDFDTLKHIAKTLT